MHGFRYFPENNRMYDYLVYYTFTESGNDLLYSAIICLHYTSCYTYFFIDWNVFFTNNAYVTGKVI